MFDVVANVKGKFTVTNMTAVSGLNPTQRVADSVRQSVKETSNIDGFTVYVAM